MIEQLDLNNALSIDVEDFFHATALSGAIDRSEWKSIPSRVEQSTNLLLEMLDEVNVKATFFVLGWVAEKHPQLVRDIAAAGHEIGSHGFSHKLVYEQSKDEFRAETLKSKQLLEDLIGEAVTGYRAASFSITPESEWAIDILIEAGFEYDSSLYPISHDLYGDRTAPRYPFVREGSNGGTIVELPLTTSTIMGMRVPVAGGGYFRLFPYWFLKWALGRVNRAENKPFVFYLHPWEFDVEQPRQAVTGFSKFRHYNNLHKSKSRLESLLADFRFGTCRELLQTWQATEGRLVEKKQPSAVTP